MNICGENFKNFLEAREFRFNAYVDSDGDTVVDFPYAGKTVKCFFTGDQGEYLSLYIVYERVPQEKALDALVLCNELNMKYKWATFYIDNDSDIMVHDDALLTPATAADEAMELMVRLIKITDDCKPLIMKVIYG